MRASRLIPFGLVGGVAIWALKETGVVARALSRPVRAVLPGPVRDLVEAPMRVLTGDQSFAPVREPAQRAMDAVGRRTVGETTRAEADEAMVDSLVRDTVDDLVATEPEGSTLDDLAHGDADVLVEAERELLTVPGEPGEGHRRRDQTAGAAAQEIAAAQVRARRNGVG